MERFHRRLLAKAENPWEPPVLIVAFGDSVTQGLTALDEHLHDEVYHARFKRLLEARHPQSTVSVINAGVSGQTTDGALSLLARDVIRHQPDLTLVAFGLNDAWNGLPSVGLYRDNLSTIVRDIRRGTTSDIILLTPNFMNMRVPDDVAGEQRAGLVASAALQNGGVVAAYAQAAREVAQVNGLPCADVYRAWERRAQAGDDTDLLLANQMNHPTAAAHAVPAQLLIELVDAAAPAGRARTS